MSIKKQVKQKAQKFTGEPLEFKTDSGVVIALISELKFYSNFYEYVKQNNYQTYCNAVQHATKENNNQ